MSVLRLPDPQAGNPLVELDGVSRMFAMRRDRSRSLQEMFIRVFRSSSQPKDIFWPLRQVSLSIMPGDCIGVIGPNGSGKSTLLKLITGILEPTEGSMIVRGRLSSLLELGAGFQGDLTGRENVFLNGSIYGLSRSQISERMNDIVAYAELGEFIDTPVKHYSSGMYVRLGFSVAIHTSPDLLLVDEVLAVGDLSFQRKCLNSIYQFRNRGGTILLVSHDTTTIQSICNRVLWLEDGLVQADGNATDVVMQYQRHVAAKEEGKVAVKDEGAEPPTVNNEARRWGTRALEILNVELCNQRGETKTIFFTGEPMTIRLHYSSNERIEQPVFGLMIHHQNGVNIFGPNTKFAGLEIPYVDGPGTVDYKLEKLPLLEGGYTISVAAVNASDTVTFDYHDRAYAFQVYPGKEITGYGMVTLDGEWRMPEVADKAVKEHQAQPLPEPIEK